MASKIDPAMAEKAIDKIGSALGKKDKKSGTESASNSTVNLSTYDSGRTGTGKKRALLIGINYFGTKAELKGCINDVKNVSNFIREGHGFSEVLTLTDDQNDPMYKPTKQNMINGLRWLVQDAQPNDSLFLHYSGHGSSQKDTSGDEADGNDETLCPVDFEQAGIITDDEMHDLVVRPLPKGCKLTAIFDCCHSGSILDLPFTYQPDGKNGVVMRMNTKEAIKAGLSAFQHVRNRDYGNALKDAFKAIKIVTDDGKQPDAKAVEKKISFAQVIMFSGCMDHQTSADAHLEGQSAGAMSWALLKVLNEQQGEITLCDLLEKLRGNLSGHFQQIPQMSTSHEMPVLEMKFSLD